MRYRDSFQAEGFDINTAVMFKGLAGLQVPARTQITAVLGYFWSSSGEKAW